MKLILEVFRDLLQRRLEKKIHTTEDSVRYTFFSAILNATNIQLEDIILEYPHPFLPNKEIDIYIPPLVGRQGLVAEFKYDRSIPSKKNLSRTKRAAKLFHDIHRLSLFQTDLNIKKWFVYVTDKEMISYFKNKENKLTDFFFLEANTILDINEQYFLNRSQTFLSNVEVSMNVKIHCIYSSSLSHHHEIRIYELIQ